MLSKALFGADPDPLAPADAKGLAPLVKPNAEVDDEVEPEAAAPADVDGAPKALDAAEPKPDGVLGPFAVAEADPKGDADDDAKGEDFADPKEEKGLTKAFAPADAAPVALEGAAKELVGRPKLAVTAGVAEAEVPLFGRGETEPELASFGFCAALRATVGETGVGGGGSVPSASPDGSGVPAF